MLVLVSMSTLKIATTRSVILIKLKLSEVNYVGISTIELEQYANSIVIFFE